MLTDQELAHLQADLTMGLPQPADRVQQLLTRLEVAERRPQAHELVNDIRTAIADAEYFLNEAKDRLAELETTLVAAK